MLQETWNNLVALEIPAIEKIIRPIVVYVVVLALFRLFGRRELAQLNPMDLAVLLLLAAALENAIIGDDHSLIGGLYGATALLGINWLVNAVSFRLPRLDKLIEGEPNVLIDTGTLDEDVMRSEKLSDSDVDEALHREGLEDVEEVRKAYLEPSGQLTILPKEDQRIDELMQRLARIEQLLIARARD